MKTLFRFTRHVALLLYLSCFITVSYGQTEAVSQVVELKALSYADSEAMTYLAQAKSSEELFSLCSDVLKIGNWNTRSKATALAALRLISSKEATRLLLENILTKVEVGKGKDQTIYYPAADALFAKGDYVVGDLLEYLKNEPARNSVGTVAAILLGIVGKDEYFKLTKNLVEMATPDVRLKLRYPGDSYLSLEGRVDNFRL